MQNKPQPSLLLRLRHPLRALAWALAVCAVGWGTLFPDGILAAMLGAALGVALGEALGRSKLRLLAVLLFLGGAFSLFWWLGDALVQYSWFAQHLGPGRALWWSAVLRYAAAAALVVASLRALALRAPALHAVELAALVAALVALFSGHRDGVIARPLWLGDWAWRQGVDPTHLLLALGGVVVLLVALLSLAETRSRYHESRISPLAWLFIPGLAALAAVVLSWVGLPTPKTDDRLGLTQDDNSDSYGKTIQGAKDGKGDASQGKKLGEGGPKTPVKLDEHGDPIKPKLGPDGLPLEPQEGGDDPSSAPKDSRGGSQSQPGSAAKPPQEPNLDDQDSQSQQSPSPMAVIILGDDYSPPSEIYYFRQEAWSEYNGARLLSSSRADADTDTLQRFPTGPTSTPFEKLGGRVLVHGTVALLIDHKKPFALETPILFEPAPNPNRARFLNAYRFTSLAQRADYKDLVGKKAGDVTWSPELAAYYTAAPTDDRYRVLALSLIGSLPASKRGDPFLKALAIKKYLDENMSYSTANRHAGVDDPTADFLFGDHIGYCVHMAHAAVFLFRSVGIPSRIGTGYAIKEDQRQGSTILLRSDNAHAWPELYLDGLGWVVLDITPQTNLDPPGEPIDRDLQRMLGEMARQEPPPEAARSSAGGVDWAAMFSLGLPSLLLTALFLLYAVKLWRRLRPYVASRAQLPRVGYRAALDLLAEAGLSREFGETREAFAKRFATRLPTLGRLTQHHLSARLGAPGREARAAYSPQEWRAALRGLRLELAQSTKGWRRLAGLLYPLSFFQSK